MFAILYLLTIVLANAAIGWFGIVPVGFGLMAPAAVYFVGLSFTLRDAVQERYGKRATLACIGAGAALSALVNPALALASGASFLVSESLDLSVYTPLRRRGFLKAVTASNAVGLVADSFVFLTLAFGSLAFLPGQILGKALVTAGTVAIIAIARLLRSRLATA